MHPKWTALACLVIQNSSLALMMRYTFLLPKTSHIYLASTAVFITEAIKLSISFICCYLLDANSDMRRFGSILRTEVFVNPRDWFQLTIPSLLYTLQNSLQYISMSQLSAPVFQLLYQMKIVTTALFSVLLLSKSISVGQWLAVVALTGGVVMVQLSQQHDLTSVDLAVGRNSLVGFISVLCGCMTSGFAGVYFEMILKSGSTSLWVRNIQLSFIGTVTGFITCYYRNHSEISEYGFFIGYNRYVWYVILLQAAGGLLVALVVKFADNVLKVFATSISILLSGFVSWYVLKDFEITMSFLFGSSFILASVFLFTTTGTNNNNITMSKSVSQLSILPISVNMKTLN